MSVLGRLVSVALGAAAMPGAGAWVRRIAPVDIVGHAFYIYDVR